MWNKEAREKMVGIYALYSRRAKRKQENIKLGRSRRRRGRKKEKKKNVYRNNVIFIRGGLSSWSDVSTYSVASDFDLRLWWLFGFLSLYIKYIFFF